METIRQLNAFVIDLKTLRHAVIFGADLRERRLACREVIHKHRAIFTNVRLNAHREQELQERVAIFFGIGDIAQVKLRRHLAQLGFIRRQRIYLQMALERLLVGNGLGGLALQHLLQKIVHLVHQAVHIIMRAIPLQHREFRVVMTPHLFITKASAQLIHRPTARRQQALHVIFRAGHQIEINPLGMAGTDETRGKREQVDIGYRRLAHAGGFHLQYAAVREKTADLRHDGGAF
ncbi:hypothetical protein BN129_2722 [Cronobacter sakazakii 701]|nr:hypothetical protein BN129_2722 [Cronobacter sakazakii 701]